MIGGLQTNDKTIRSGVYEPTIKTFGRLQANDKNTRSKSTGDDNNKFDRGSTGNHNTTIDGRSTNCGEIRWMTNVMRWT